LNYLDDQLVLGIKGTLSVVELKVLRQRLLAGQEAKARRGELFKRLPIGYARDVAGKVVAHPDRRIYEAIRLVFTKFRELWSVRQTFNWFRDHDVELPANPIQGTGLVWKIPSQSLIRDILCNPFDETGVTFRYKDYRRNSADRQQVMTLGVDEFIRRFLLHVHRIRHYGLLASSARKASLARARDLFSPSRRRPMTTCRTSRSMCAHHAPCCGGHMIIIETFERWRQPRAPPHCTTPTARTSP
jgi:hypothetical protein